MSDFRRIGTRIFNEDHDVVIFEILGSQRYVRADKAAEIVTALRERFGLNVTVAQVRNRVHSKNRDARDNRYRNARADLKRPSRPEVSAMFDAEAHREARHYRGSFEL